MEAELATSPPQPRPRPEVTHATERCSRELHLRTPGRAARVPRHFRVCPLRGPTGCLGGNGDSECLPGTMPASLGPHPRCSRVRSSGRPLRGSRGGERTGKAEAPGIRKWRRRPRRWLEAPQGRPGGGASTESERPGRWAAEAEAAFVLQALKIYRRLFPVLLEELGRGAVVRWG